MSTITIVMGVVLPITILLMFLYFLYRVEDIGVELKRIDEKPKVRSTSSKLTPQQVSEIKRLLRLGHNQQSDNLWNIVFFFITVVISCQLFFNICFLMNSLWSRAW